MRHSASQPPRWQIAPAHRRKSDAPVRSCVSPVRSIPAKCQYYCDIAPLSPSPSGPLGTYRACRRVGSVAGMVTSESPRCEPPATSRKQLLGINLVRGRQHHRFMGNDERMRAQPSVEAVTPPPPPDALPAAHYRPVSPDHQLPVAAVGVFPRAAENLGAVVARTGHHSDAATQPPTRRTSRWTPAPGSDGQLRSCWRSAAAPALPRCDGATQEPHLDVVAAEVYRRGWRSCSAPSTGNTSPISGWSAAMQSTFWNTCSNPARWPGSGFSSPTPGRRPATTSADCCSRTRWP